MPTTSHTTVDPVKTLQSQVDSLQYNKARAEEQAEALMLQSMVQSTLAADIQVSLDRLQAAIAAIEALS
jgi:uncharacterized protein (DUF2342 family)